MPSDRHQVKTYLDDAEKAHLDRLCARLQVKQSDLLRRLVMAYSVPDPQEFDAWQGIRDLLKVNADLARLGNLFKLAIAEAPDAELGTRLRTLAGEIGETQRAVKTAVGEVRASLQRRRP